MNKLTVGAEPTRCSPAARGRARRFAHTGARDTPWNLFRGLGPDPQRAHGGPTTNAALMAGMAAVDDANRACPPCVGAYSRSRL